MHSVYDSICVLWSLPNLTKKQYTLSSVYQIYFFILNWNIFKFIKAYFRFTSRNKNVNKHILSPILLVYL